MTDIHDFDDIRPYTKEELPEVYDKLLADPSFKNALSMVYKDVPYEAIAQTIRSCGTALELQKRCVYPALKKLIKEASAGMSTDFSAIESERDLSHTFISNHRDIVLDSAFLCCALIENDMNTVEIAIGDNLLIHPWIKDFVRVNKSFIVQRALTMRQMLAASAKMSRYIHYAVNEKDENIWIAQREGRAKDSDDRTQESVLKMLAMGGEGSVISRLKHLNIVPLSISYEYDPCDYLKAMEFQNKRDIPGFKKSKQDDLDNMQTGIFGYKGRIHYHAAPCINDWLDTLDPDMPKTELFTAVAAHIDHEIHSSYMLYAGNYVAADNLVESYPEESNARHYTMPRPFASHYTEEERERFDAYIEKRIGMIDLPNKDEKYLRKQILLMYANPVFNNEAAGNK
ncbi:MAG: 1-acyl-sn-glycerol-3-phosphate acyltransferase [Bacteroides sp.]|nr:1-acyl-sn-glycerol-3-phosphate acyltransferase [Roseburia sp.]MCM1346878.1 1-acyl-sn-glycerol-3-phosphate acyltransferase [Bacteroides sp.]MCM1421421.1 1-acyl-sn-glycerol-3-phosphate acyltransferase [Bacteroides sp.]